MRAEASVTPITMASNLPRDCCAKTFLHSGTPTGKLETLDGVLTYVTGDKSSKNVIIFYTDVFGPVYKNSQLLADMYAQEGYFVVAPDLFDGDYVPQNLEGFDWGAYMYKHRPEVVQAITEKTWNWIKANTSASFVGTLGYCFGARSAVRDIGNGRADASSIFHPSFVTIEEIAAIKAPLLISAAETDEIYTVELRQKTEEKLREIGARYVQTVYSNTSHGFACRGDPSDKLAMAAMEKAFWDTCWWFSSARKFKNML